MINESAVQFETDTRVHFGLAVKNLPQSVDFYRVLLGQEPAKTRPGYAKFEVADPPLNLAINKVGGATGPNNPVAHFGIQVKSTAAVRKMAERLEKAGINTAREENVTCCFAVQDKIWATDTDGNKWEVFVVLDNDAADRTSTGDECCLDAACCRDEASLPPSRETLAGICCR